MILCLAASCLPVSANESVTEKPHYLSSYEYDAINNLTKVTQGTQERSFAYDLLSRLLCASNPEARVGAASCATLPETEVHYVGNLSSEASTPSALSNNDHSRRTN